MPTRSLLASLAAAVVVISVPLAGCNAGGGSGGGAQVEVTRRVERGMTPGNRTLVFDGYNGDITLTDTTAQKASLTFIKRARGADRNAARQLLSRIRIEERGGEDEFAYKLTSGASRRTSIDVRGSIPKGTPLRVYLRNGEIALSGLRGPLDATGENGDIRIGGAARDVRAETRNGSVEAGLRRVPQQGEVRLETQNGDLRLTFPASTAADVEARTDAGAIRLGGLQFASRRLRESGAGARFQGALGENPEAHVRLRTENGDVRLRQGTVRRLEGVGRDTTGRDSTARDTTGGLRDTTSGDSLFMPSPGSGAPTRRDTGALGRDTASTTPRPAPLMGPPSDTSSAPSRDTSQAPVPMLPSRRDTASQQ